MTRNTTNYDDCKGPLRHAWFDDPGTGFAPAPFGAAVHYRCDRCNTVRRDVINQFNGELLTRHYYYPEGYSDTHGSKPDYAQLRVMDYRRQTGTTKASQKKGA